mmetsp:Transcript_42364/g.76025  ORF Transcript_42364/g.76025 Transcript_42364/m.76025 type:complete len:116 (-) Transcript_42364:1416-1763(-)
MWWLDAVCTKLHSWLLHACACGIIKSSLQASENDSTSHIKSENLIAVPLSIIEARWSKAKLTAGYHEEMHKCATILSLILCSRIFLVASKCVSNRYLHLQARGWVPFLYNQNAEF